MCGVEEGLLEWVASDQGATPTAHGTEASVAIAHGHHGTCDFGGCHIRARITASTQAETAGEKDVQSDVPPCTQADNTSVERELQTKGLHCRRSVCGGDIE